VKYNVLPLDDRFAERGDSRIAGRPELISGDRQIVFGALARVPALATVNMANRSFAVTAQVDVPKDGAEGVIVAMGGITGGWSLYAKDGKAKWCYNFFGIEQTYVESAGEIPPGERQVRLEFAYDGGGIGKGGKYTLCVDGKKTGEGRIEQTEPFAFGEESLDLGHEAGSPVTYDYGRNGSTEFTGKVLWVEFDAGVAADDHNHLITPEERLQVAMAKQ
jgi:arylsulfatase